ncbi:hypothetical protein GSI_03126 [Ganoderma sinense ZZ0214-1]|uniref:Uncharacterized protein n=1 Tax=Ganoderma sinense ZZ0214-1 TaxID=1077348 RepID=A0A2G8SKQ9_9APHY|nr:hypothetical protein GSI_03126 [Ganoderma sinense ZZ0214-1]
MLAQDRTALAHVSQIRGRDKFLDPTHPWMPPALPSWDRAMRAVDRSAPALPATELWGYWIPEPALLLGPKDPVRARHYLFNWILAQPVWLYMLQVPGSGAVKVAPQSWRDFLRGVIPDEPSSTTMTGRRAFEIKQVFGRVFADNDLVTADAEAGEGVREAEWHGGRLTLDAFNARIAPCIVWEVFELAFRYELLALDRALRPMATTDDIVQREARVARVFPAGSLWAVSRLPDGDSWGLFTSLPHRRINALNALREILTSWMRCPPEIRNAEPLQLSDSVETIEQMELWLALFYTQMFFDISGRAPIVPHRWPGLSSKN